MHVQYSMQLGGGPIALENKKQMDGLISRDFLQASYQNATLF